MNIDWYFYETKNTNILMLKIGNIFKKYLFSIYASKKK